MLVRLLSLLTLGATSALAAATSTATALEPFNPPASALVGRSRYRTLSQVEDREFTNAKRLASGLPLKPPRRRNYGSGHGHQPPSHPQPSGYPGSGSCTNGHLEVRDHTGSCIGYVGKDCNSYGQYGVTNDADLHLVVSIDLEAAASGGTDIKTVNGPDANFPYFGGISGYTSDCDCANLKKNSKNYAYLGATSQTLPFSSATTSGNSFTSKTKITRGVQSAIFSYDSETHEIAPQWINEDSSQPETHLGYSQGSLVLTGDRDIFSTLLGGADTKWVSLHFVPTS